MSLPHLILGLLTWDSFSGYDLNKVFQNTIQYFWWTEQSQIYRALHRMENDGWVEVEQVIQEDSPNKKVYHLTPTGRAELLQWLAHSEPEVRPHEAWVGKMFFAYLLTDAQLIELFETRITQTEALIATLDERQALMAGLPVPNERTRQLQRMTLEYGTELLREEVRWLRQRLEVIRGFGSETDAPHNSTP